MPSVWRSTSILAQLKSGFLSVVTMTVAFKRPIGLIFEQHEINQSFLQLFLTFST